MAGYVGTSRVKLKETALIAQPFCPALFALGAPVGPTILMRVLRGELPADDVEAEFNRIEEERRRRKVETDLLKMHWLCKSCRLAGRDVWALQLPF